MREMAQQITEKKYRWECPSCQSHYYDEPITLGLRNGRVVRINPICTKCFHECINCKTANAQGQLEPTRIEYGENCPKCGTKRQKIDLEPVELDPEDPTFGLTETGGTSYPAVEAGITSPGASVSNVPNASYMAAIPFTLTQPLTVKEVHVHAHANCNIKAAVYTLAAAYPAALKIANNTPVAATADQWNARSLTSTFLDTGSYYAAVKSDTNQSIHHTTGGSSFYVAHAYATDFPDPFPAGGSGYSNWSVHVTGVEIGGYMYFTKATLADDADPVISTSLFCHAASGHFRKAIFDNSTPKAKKWESDTVPAADNDWKVSGIGGGAPPTLALLAGTYHLGWQYDGAGDVPSYTAGSAGDGFHKAQAYGPFPATISGETSNSKKWSMYVTYTIASEAEAESQIVLSEGINCHLIDAVVDYRQIATVVILKGGKDANGVDIVVTVSDEEAAATYGRLVLPFSESQWNTPTLAELRANQLLSVYKQPAVTISVDALDCFVKKGDTITLVSSTLGLNNTYLVDSVEHVHDEGGVAMRLQLRNRTPSIVDFLTMLQRNLEKR